MTYFNDLPQQIPERGDLLISEPFLPDPNFERTVVLLCESNEEGSFGFVINKPSLIKLKDVLEDLNELDKTVYVGGPVQQDTLHFIHKAGDMLEGGTQIGNGLFWGGNFEQLKILSENKQLDPDHFMFFVGYSGWGEGQLLDEIREKSWIVYKSATPIQIFDTKPEELWREILKEMGGRYRMFSNYPTDPRLN